MRTSLPAAGYFVLPVLKVLLDVLSLYLITWLRPAVQFRYTSHSLGTFSEAPLGGRAILAPVRVLDFFIGMSDEGSDAAQQAAPETCKAVWLVGHGGYDKLQVKADTPVKAAGDGEVRVAVQAWSVKLSCRLI